MQSPNLPCYHNGDEVLQLVYFNKSHFGRDIGLLVVIWLVLRVLSYIILLYKAK
ncbi:unnamed protein product, partial [Rotaria socialis]